MGREEEKHGFQEFMADAARQIAGKIHGMVDPFGQPDSLGAETFPYDGPGRLKGFVMVIGSGKYAEMLEEILNVLRAGSEGFQTHN